MKKITKLGTNTAFFLIALFIFSACIVTQSSFSAQAQTPQAQGRYVAVISDADMPAMAYFDGQLGENRGIDQLTLVSLPLDASGEPTSQIEVSNSVVNPVFSIENSPDGNTIFVAETLTQRESGDKTMSDLEPGTIVQAIDVSNPATPSVIDTVEVGVRPKTVDVHPDGNLLVVATSEPKATLVFVSFQEGKFGTPKSFPLKGFNPSDDYYNQGGILAHYVEWHPSADVIAVTINDRSRVAFYQVERDASGNVIDINLWGNRVQVTKFAMSGRFSRDGRFFISNDLQWGPDLENFYSNAPPSMLTVIQLADLDAPADEAQHLIVGGAAVPRNAESIAVSQDGSLIATLNIGQYWYEKNHPNYSDSSISLLEFDQNSGRIENLGDWSFDGILPEGIAFDANDDYLAVGVFEYPDSSKPPGGLEFWRIDREGWRGNLAISNRGVDREPNLSLVRSDYIIDTGAGAHSLVLVP